MYNATCRTISKESKRQACKQASSHFGTCKQDRAPPAAMRAQVNMLAGYEPHITSSNVLVRAFFFLIETFWLLSRTLHLEVTY